jgi:sugar-specific transcriptional regulator TrmB
MKNTNILIESLKQLGLNQLESEVYLYLLKNKQMTAYKVAKSINKPTANVYKAIDSLSQKGAVIIESNKNKQCKAISPKEFLGHYEKEMLNNTHKLKTKLNGLETDDYDEKTYSIESTSLIFERFENMMKRAKVIAVIDAFPDALDKVKNSIIEASERGIDIYIQVYKPITIPGADIAFSEIGDIAISHWQSQQLNLIIDGEEYLIALMNKDLTEVKQATWSNNYYMACILHAGRMHEQTIMKINAKKDKKSFKKKVLNILKKQKYFFNSNIPGFNKLLKTK